MARTARSGGHRGAPPAKTGNDAADRAAALAKRLGDDEYAHREAATAALKALGETALPAVREAAAGPDPEARQRRRRSCTTS